MMLLTIMAVYSGLVLKDITSDEHHLPECFSDFTDEPFYIFALVAVGALWKLTIPLAIVAYIWQNREELFKKFC